MECYGASLERSWEKYLMARNEITPSKDQIDVIEDFKWFLQNDNKDILIISDISKLDIIISEPKKPKMIPRY